MARSLLPRFLRRRGTHCRYILIVFVLIFFFWPSGEKAAKIGSTTASTRTTTSRPTTDSTTSSSLATLNDDIYKSYQSEQLENEDRVQNLILDSFEKTSSEFAPFLKEIEAKELQDTKNSEKRLLDGLRDSITPKHITRKPNGQFDIEALAKFLNNREQTRNMVETTRKPKTFKPAGTTIEVLTSAPSTEAELVDLIKIDRSILPDDFAVNLDSGSPYFDDFSISQQLEALKNAPDFVEIDAPVEESKIPNIVHYIWFGCHEFKIHHYLSVLSAVKIQKPEKIYFHTNCKPSGTYFPTVERHLNVVYRAPPTEVWGQPVTKVSFFVSEAKVGHAKYRTRSKRMLHNLILF